MTRDAMASRRSYREFYEALGSSYPETEVVYSEPLGIARRKVVRSYLRRLAKRGHRLLDVGCNDGHYTLYYASLGPAVHGIDISPSLIARAREAALRQSLARATFEVANIEDFLGGPFQAVLFSEVLEHLEEPGNALSSIARCLVPGGALVLTTPAPALVEISLAALVRDRLFSSGLLRPKAHSTKGSAIEAYLARDFHYRHDEYYPLPLRRWVEAFGFRCVFAGTFFYTGRFFHRLNAYPRLQMRVPVLHLLGVNNFQVFRRL